MNAKKPRKIYKIHEFLRAGEKRPNKININMSLNKFNKED